ncbi:glutathione S-transferase gst, partial [Trifolium pratense]
MASNHEEVKLFGIVGSPFVTRVEIALNLKVVEYKFVEEKWKDFSDTPNSILPSDPYKRALAPFWA